jgi:hypothetical protein
LGNEIKATVIADRGFDRPAFLQFIKNRGQDFVIRASRGSKIRKNNGKWRILGFHLIKRGQRRMLRKITYTAEREVMCHLALLWDPNQKEPWLLLCSNSYKDAREAGNLYAQRMKIEEMFRSFKNEQTGFDLKRLRSKRWIGGYAFCLSRH